MADEYPLQISLSLGGGRPPSVLTNIRGEKDDETIERLADVGPKLVPVTRFIETAWNDTAPAAVTPQVSQPQQQQAPNHQQAVQNVQQGLGGQVVRPPQGARPGDGDLHPSKFCEDCGSQMKVIDRVSKSSNKRFRKLVCSADETHKPDWSEQYR